MWVSQLGLFINQARWPAAANSNSWYLGSSIFLVSWQKAYYLLSQMEKVFGSFSRNYNFSTFLELPSMYVRWDQSFQVVFKDGIKIEICFSFKIFSSNCSSFAKHSNVENCTKHIHKYSQIHCTTFTYLVMGSITEGKKLWWQKFTVQVRNQQYESLDSSSRKYSSTMKNFPKRLYLIMLP